MSAKHTPGPWTWEFHPRLKTKAIALTSGKVDVLLATGDEEHSWANIASEADARLIAAAPDLLAALIELVQLKDDRPPDYETRKPVAWENARAVIAEATGTAS